jgi:hypothetical protein
MEETQEPTPTQINEPNLYELSCDGAKLTYSTSGIDGRPHLSYDAGDRCRAFSGDEIRVAETEIGRLVSVTLETIPDLHVVTLTVLLPQINLEGSASRLRTEVITTTHRTSIGGPRLVKGQVLTYATATLEGVARSVAS